MIYPQAADNSRQIRSWFDMKKNAVLKIAGAVLLLSCIFSACAGKKTPTADTKNDGRQVVLVYDSAGDFLFAVEEGPELEYLAAIIGESVGQGGAENPAGLFAGVPKDAEILYRYVFQNERGQTAEMHVFSNYKKAQITDAPLVSSLTWELSDEDYDMLTHPDRFKKR